MVTFRPEQTMKGADLALENASTLLTEAELLLSSGSFARSYTMSHLASEELAKSLMLDNYTHSVLSGGSMKSRRLIKDLTNHLEKIKLLHFIDDVATGEPDGTPEDNAWRAHLLNSKLTNVQKNQSLYVGHNASGDFFSPVEQFNEVVAKSILGLTKQRLIFFKEMHANNKRIAKELARNPDFRKRFQGRLKGILATLSSLLKKK